jgi:3-phosphoshikimate 1-carboxyvinyltransferase
MSSNDQHPVLEAAMGVRPGTTAEQLKTWGEMLFQKTIQSNSEIRGKVLGGSIAVAANTVAAIYEATIHLLTTLLEAEAMTPDGIIGAFFITSLTAEYPARAAREHFGWRSVPLLCVREAAPPPDDTLDNLSIVLFAQTGRTSTPAYQPLLRGIRGAVVLENQTKEQIQHGIRWLFEQSQARNKIHAENVLGAVVTVTSDLDMAAAHAHASDCAGPALSLLTLPELDVPHAPKPCIRTLLIASTHSQPQPVYSERAMRLLRPDLLQPDHPRLAPSASPSALSDLEPSALPQTMTISPSGPLSGSIVLPGSKYHTLRAILAALLAEGESTIEQPAISDDTTVLLRACVQLGAAVDARQQADGRCVLSIRGIGGRVQPDGPLTLDMGNAGAVLRLLLGICATSPEAITFTTPYPESLGRRPNADLLQALTQLGARTISRGNNGTLPITVLGSNLHGGRVQLSGQQSSQFVSALLFLGPLLAEELELEITDTLASASFVDLTIQMLQQAGITVITRERHTHYLIPGNQHYQSLNYRIPGDYPSAAALLAAVAIAKGEITLRGLPLEDQDGTALLTAFAKMGLEFTRSGRNGADLTARASGPLRGLSVDGSQAIDSVPCLAAAACFASTPSRIFNVANLRLKESDRLYDLSAALGALGCQISPSADALSITPATSIAGGVTVDAHSDHRLAQALAAAGLGSQRSIILQNAQHIAKSYPRFFDDLASLGARLCSVSS